MSSGRIETEKVGGELWLLTLRGEHDIATSPSLRDEIEQLMTICTKMVVDLSSVDFMDSSVIAALVFAQRHLGHDPHGGLTLIVAPNTPPERVLHLVGADKSIPTYTNLEHALVAFGSSRAGTTYRHLQPDLAGIGSVVDPKQDRGS